MACSLPEPEISYGVNTPWRTRRYQFNYRGMNVNNNSQTLEATRAPLQRPAKPQRILVVEDDSDLRRHNTEALLLCGYQVDAAEDGAVAWNSIQVNRYDLMVTDNNMPKVTGIDLLKKLHAARLTIPVIIATGILPVDEFARHPWLQPAAILIKPYSIDELIGMVAQVLRAAEGSGKQTAPPPASQSDTFAEDWRKLLRGLKRNNASGDLDDDT
jgi:DNA-binding response OmpR family regulator